ncbi:MAG TPA: hypothetical protein VFL83_13950 [Anaeromyxobacter sp.]|nr:hypothetical protein [Anaeromyxobacter sp.]
MPRRSAAALAVAALLLAGFHAVAIAIGMNPVRHGGAWDRFVDSDSYTRLVRVADLARGGPWYDRTLRAANHPDGFELHWSRLPDLLVLVPAKALSAVMPLDDAIAAVGLLYGPALLLLLLAVLAWGTRPFLRDGAFLLLCGFVATAPHVSAQFGPGFVDHHAVQLLLFVAAAAALARGGESRGRDAAAGVLVAGALWASAESLVVLVAVAGALALAWVLDGGPGAAARLRRVGAGLLGGVALAVVVDRPPAEWLARSYERISAVHLGIAAAVLAFAAALGAAERLGVAPSRARRVAVAAGAALPIAAALVLAFPGVLRSPYSASAQVVQAAILPFIAVERPLVPKDPGTAFDFVLGFVPAAVALAYCLGRLRRADPDARFRALLGATTIVVLGAYTLYVNRGLAFLGAATLVPWTEAVVAAWGRARAAAAPARRLAARAGVVALAGAHLAIAGAVAATWLRLSAFRNEPICDWSPLAPLIRSTPGDGAILTEVFDGPELAWRTGRPVIGAPYHGNGEGILATYQLLLSGPGEEGPLLDRRRVEWIALCRRVPLLLARDLQRRPHSLGGRAARGLWIDGFAHVLLPPPLEEQMVLYKRVAPRAAGR